MARMKRGMVIASMLMLASIVLSACKSAYSQAPAVTNTPIPQSNLFASAQPTTMENVSVFATGSAIAQLTTSPGAPAVNTATLGPGVTPLAVTATSTPLVSVNPTSTATLAVPSGPTSTSVPAGARSEYVLKPGEFPYCIARRYNVDPDEMLRLSGLSSAQADSLSAGTVLKIPQSGSFPGDRSWHDHPATFTVGVTYDTNTVYGVACYYGDIEPLTIANHNNISVDATLTVGQTLNIPQ